MLKDAEAGTFCVENPPSRSITRAAERYLEQYGDPLVMNTYLKITIPVLAAISLMLGTLIFRSQQRAASHPGQRLRAGPPDQLWRKFK